MDGLFAGPASERRRFLDRLVASFDPRYRTRGLGHFERAMQQRKPSVGGGGQRRRPLRSLRAQHGRDRRGDRRRAGLLVAELASAIDERRRAVAAAAFPWAELTVSGLLENALVTRAAVDVEDDYCSLLAGERERRSRRGTHALRSAPILT